MYRILMLAVDSRLIFRDGLTALWAQYDDIRDEHAGDRFCYLVPAMTGRDVKDPMALCRVPAVRLEQRGFSYCVSVHEDIEALELGNDVFDDSGLQ